MLSGNEKKKEKINTICFLSSACRDCGVYCVNTPYDGLQRRIRNPTPSIAAIPATGPYGSLRGNNRLSLLFYRHILSMHAKRMCVFFEFSKSRVCGGAFFFFLSFLIGYVFTALNAASVSSYKTRAHRRRNIIFSCHDPIFYYYVHVFIIVTINTNKQAS